MTSARDPWTGAVLDAVPHPMLVIDASGGVAQVNRAATRILGYPDPRELKGRTSHDALHRHREDGTLYPAHECPIVRASPGRSRTPAREIFIDRSGHAVPVTWTVSALPDASYKLLSFHAAIAGGAVLARRLPSAADIRSQIAASFRDPDLTPLRIAATNHMSVRALQSILAGDGISPASLIRSERLRHAAELLRRGMPPRVAAYESGFGDPDTFSRAFRRHFGVAPSAYTARSPRGITRG
ncbi:helix-turn-helix domain-containing protein [Microbacterium sp. NPDC087592]|uniref:helix-turn-helix transcriptional regulator n=1 Tax=Microbacterium sp. NPDC087592 TaxID=3364193 RepID=UPI0037F3A322